MAGSASARSLMSQVYLAHAAALLQRPSASRHALNRAAELLAFEEVRSEEAWSEEGGSEEVWSE